MKKRAPIEQLRIAGEHARQQLIRRGVVSAENLEEQTKLRHPDLVLPGIPSYLPYKWTIKSSQRIMYDLFKIWQFKNKDNPKLVSNLAEFITYCITEMNHQEEIAKKKMEMQQGILSKIKNVPVLSKIFEPVNEYGTIKGVKKFFVDSFAVAIMINGHASTTGEYAEFFFKWTDRLYNVWEEQQNAKTKKKT